MSNSVFTYVVLVDQHYELLLLESFATAMLLHQQMAQHIDHIEWGEEPDRRGSYIIEEKRKKKGSYSSVFKEVEMKLLGPKFILKSGCQSHRNIANQKKNPSRA
jgi:hypothetical protein